MISDEVLERWLGEVAEDVPLPEGGCARALAPVESGSASRLRRWSAPRPSRRIVLTAAAGLIVVGGGVGLVATSSGSSSRSSSSSSALRSASGEHRAAGDGSGAPGRSAPTGGSAPAAGPAAGVQGTGPSSGSSVPSIDQRVIRTATVDVTVPKGTAATALAHISALAGGTGYVSASARTTAGGDPGGTVTLRVRAAQYAQVRDALAAGRYGTVTSLEEHGQDVTAQYTDLSARITALEATRATYLTLLSRASSIGDVLAVQQRVTAVQTQVEELQGQRRVLTDRSDDATVTVTVSEQGDAAVVVSHHRSGWSRAAHDAVHSVVRFLQGLVAASGVILIVLAVVGFGMVVGRFAYRRVQRRVI